jgi:hypothetical protein
MVTTLSEETLKVDANRGCPQGKVLSPLMCRLVMDELLGKELNGSGYYIVGHADDIVFLINGKFPSTDLEVL